MARKPNRRAERPAPDAIEMPEAAPEPKAGPEKASHGTDLSKIHELAMKRWRRADEADRENRERAYEDLEFLEPGGQWEVEARRLREEGGRPCLEFDRLGTTCAQITGDIRQMRPAIKVVPVDSRGDPETAEVIAGLVRYVENRSDAAAVYFAAADQAVPAGIGHWKVVTEYGSDSTFEQEIAIAPVPDGIGVRWDPDAVKKTREDATFCFIPIDMSREGYDEKWPDHPCEEIGGGDDARAGLSDWSTPDVVRIAEYYLKRSMKKRLALMPDGEARDLTEADPEDVVEAEALAAQGVARIESRDGYRVERYLITARGVLEGPDLIPGRLIPVVPVLGVEQVIAKKRTRRGVVRKARDAQRAYNYARSTQTEVVALQPKAPFTGPKEMFQGYESIWSTANNQNHPFLPYNLVSNAPGLRPERVQPPVASAGLAELTRESAEDIKGVTGVYDASLGAPSNESSGKAIMARQREGDVGSYVYIDNFGRSIRHTGAIIVGMIPHVYDTERTLRIVGEDGKVDVVRLNEVQGLATDGQPDAIRNDVTVGAYDVAFEMGPGYTTKREAAADGITAFMQAAPQSAPLLLDLLAKMQDWPMADKVGKRVRAMLPPAIQAEEAAESGEPPPAPPPSPPGAEIEAAKLNLEHRKIGVDEMRLQAEMAKVRAELELAAIEASRPPEPLAAAGALASPAPPAGPDPRLDALTIGMEQLAHVVAMILETLGEGQPPPDPEPPPNLLPTDPTQAPPGAFSFDPSALDMPGAEPVVL